jgi:tripartite-type tricarboxylate transporter receptor subunit TctC
MPREVRPVIDFGRIPAMTTRRSFLQLSAAALAAPALPRGAAAQAYPTRQIKAMVPFAAGSTIDIVGRLVTDPLSRALKQTIVIENRGGAGGAVGTAMVAKAAPDGYTILLHAAAHSAAPAAYPKLAYDPVRDFSAVIPFGSVPNVTLVRPDRGIKTLKDLVAAGKGGKLSFASAGVASATHWAAERLRLAAGFQALHVPFKGGPAALTEVMAGRVDFTCMGLGSALAFIRDGKLVPVAVSTPKRSPALPDVPTSIEAGYPDSDYIFWMGMFVPAKTPSAIIERLHAETKKVLALPDVQAKFKPQGIEPMEMTPAEFDALIKREVAANVALVKAAGLKFN